MVMTRWSPKSPWWFVSDECVGALVGVPGDDWPEPEGQLFSTQRRFTYVHEYFENKPHCGYVEVRDNRFEGYSEDYKPL